MSGFITPRAAYSVMGKLYRQVSRACLLETRSLKNNQVEITVRPKPGVEEKPYQCENRKGTFEAISKLLTGKFAHIDHPVCLHKGGDRCQYIISWEKTRSSIWKRISYYTHDAVAGSVDRPDLSPFRESMLSFFLPSRCC